MYINKQLLIKTIPEVVMRFKECLFSILAQHEKNENFLPSPWKPHITMHFIRELVRCDCAFAVTTTANDLYLGRSDSRFKVHAGQTLILTDSNKCKTEYQKGRQKKRKLSVRKCMWMTTLVYMWQMYLTTAFYCNMSARS